MTRTAPLEVRDNADRNRFEIDLGDGHFAIADYRLTHDTIMFTHTKVPQSREGEGLGTRLIEAALHSARERNLKVIPTCRFFSAYMAKHDAVHDLLDDGWRARLGLAPNA